MQNNKIRKFKVEGLSAITTHDGHLVHKMMIRPRSRHGRRTEVWIDCADGFTYQIGDTVMVEKVKPYRLAQEEGATDE